MPKPASFVYPRPRRDLHRPRGEAGNPQPPRPSACQCEPPPQHDLSDNAARAQMLDRLVARASAHARPVSGPLTPWSIPLAPLPEEAPSLGVGNVWQTLNQIRILGQYAHLLGALCSAHPFLAGAPETCVLGLEWMSSLLGPLATPSDQERRSVAQLVAICVAHKGVSEGEALFDIHRSMPLYDRAVTRALLQAHFPESREYEVDVCRCMPLSDYAGWVRQFPRWRDAGLLYPLAVASLYMPRLADWLPEQCWGNALGHAFIDAVQSMPAALVTPAPALRRLEQRWAEDTTQTNLLLGHTLDRIAVLMRVKSNGRAGDPGGFDLARALGEFPRSFGESLHDTLWDAWHRLKHSVEGAFPPSLLCAPLVRPARPTWGYATLTLQVCDTGAVRFAESELQAVAPPEDSAVHTHTPAFSPACPSFQTAARVQDVLWRTGELLTHPGVALCVLHPSLAAAPGPARDPGLVPPPGALLAAMAPGCGPPPSAFLDAMARIESAAPPVHTEPAGSRRQLLLWRLDIPNRAIVYVGDAAEAGRVDGKGQQHHALPKLLLNCKVPPCNVGGVLAADPADRVTEATLRAALRDFAASDLRGHPANTALIRIDAADASPDAPRQTTPVVHTTLAESVACFALSAPPKVATSRVHQSLAWEEDGIDPRYAERQNAANGFRYRDWVAMHAGRAGTQQSRLAAHAIAFDQLHLTAMPWLCGDTTRWVHVASTAPPVSRTLQGHTFRQAVENRFLRDPRLLPVRPGDSPAPLHSAELYAGADGQLAIVYSPGGTDRLELIAFRLADAPPDAGQ